MTETLAAIEDFTRLTLMRLRGELPVEERPRLEALEDLLRDRIDGARPAPRKIENPTAMAAGRVSMNVKPAQVTITRRGPGEADPSMAGPSISPAPVVRTVPPPPAPRSVPPQAATPRSTPPAARPAPVLLEELEPEHLHIPSVPPDDGPIIPLELPEPDRTVDLSLSDRSKLSEISASKLHRSSYTPSATPLFLEDYYEPSIAPDSSLDGNVRADRVIELGEGRISFPEEAKLLFGVSEAPVMRAGPSHAAERPVEEGEMTELRGDGEETVAGVSAPVRIEPVLRAAPPARDGSLTASNPPPARKPPSAPPAREAPRAQPAPPAHVAPPPPPRAAPPARPAPQPDPAPRIVTPVIVQLVAGGTKRGELVAFDPSAGVVSVRGSGQTEDEAIDVNEVFAIFVGHVRGIPPAPATGTRIAVRMTNDKEVVGVSPDYAPGAGAMTLVPDDRRTVDRIWIPAWSVSEIRFA